MFGLTTTQKVVLTPEAQDRRGRRVGFNQPLVWENSDPTKGDLVVAEDTFSAEFLALASGAVVITARMGDISGTIDGTVVDAGAFQIVINAGEPVEQE
jgi:hypothetical protein